MKKYYINLTEQERSQIIHSLIDKKNALMAQGRYDTGVSAEYGDKLITLSTCEYSGQNSRLVVVAKKVTESGGSNAPSNDGATEIQS